MADWRRMCSGDWKLPSPGRTLAVAYVYRTAQGYAWMTASGWDSGYTQSWRAATRLALNAAKVRGLIDG